MGRIAGFWWAPDSAALLVAAGGRRPGGRWWIADPAHPGAAPAEVAYPAAGTANAEVGCMLFGLDGSRLRRSTWDRDRVPVSGRGALVGLAARRCSTCSSRDQRRSQILAVDPADGSTSVICTQTRRSGSTSSPGCRPGARAAPADVRIADGAAQPGARRPPGHLRRPPLPFAARDRRGRRVLFSASDRELARAGPRLAPRPGRAGAAERLPRRAQRRAAPGSCGALPRPVWTAPVGGPSHHDGEVRGEIASLRRDPAGEPGPAPAHAGSAAVRTALLLPTGPRPGRRPLPVLMDPYGGPHGQRVVAAHNALLTPSGSPTRASR